MHKLQFILTSLLGSITFIDALDITVRVIAGVATVTVAFIQWRSYQSRKRLEDIQYKIELEKLNKLKNE